MSWGMPYCAPAMGSKLVMPGQKVDGESLHRLFEQEQVTFANGVPTVWLGYVQYLQAAGVKTDDAQTRADGRHRRARAR